MFPPTPAQSFDTLYTPQYNTPGKRSLQLDVQDFPVPKRHEGVAGAELTAFSPYPASASVTGSSNWAVDTQLTPASSNDVGLSDEAADVCATWFSKYNVLPRLVLSTFVPCGSAQFRLVRLLTFQ